MLKFWVKISKKRTPSLLWVGPTLPSSSLSYILFYSSVYCTCGSRGWTFIVTINVKYWRHRDVQGWRSVGKLLWRSQYRIFAHVEAFVHELAHLTPLEVKCNVLTLQSRFHVEFSLFVLLSPSTHVMSTSGKHLHLSADHPGLKMGLCHPMRIAGIF